MKQFQNNNAKLTRLVLFGHIVENDRAQLGVQKGNVCGSS